MLREIMLLTPKKIKEIAEDLSICKALLAACRHFHSRVRLQLFQKQNWISCSQSKSLSAWIFQFNQIISYMKLALHLLLQNLATTRTVKKSLIKQWQLCHPLPTWSWKNQNCSEQCNWFKKATFLTNWDKWPS